MGHVEELRRADEFGRLDLVAAQLRDAALDRVAVLGILVLDDGDRHAVDEEHHVRPATLARRRLEFPLPGDVQGVGAGRVEIHDADAPMPLLPVVVPLPLTAQPCEHVAIALDGRRQRLQPLDDLTNRLGAHPWVEGIERRTEIVAEQHSGLAAPLRRGVLGRNGSPADLRRMGHHGKLDRRGFADAEHAYHPRLAERRGVCVPSAGAPAPCLTVRCHYFVVSC